MSCLKNVFSALLITAATSASVFATPDFGSGPVRRAGWSFDEARKIPVQVGGRVKPLDSFAREIVLFETGSRKFEGWDPVDMLFSQLATPDAWNGYRFIQITREDVRRQLGLDEKRTYYTPQELMGNSVLAQYAQHSGGSSQVTAPIANTSKADPREQEFRRVFERLGAFRRVVTGEGWVLVPVASPAAAARGIEAGWSSLAESDPRGDLIRKQFIDMLKAYQKSDEDAFERSARLVKASVEGEIPGWTDISRLRISIEATYNSVRPFMIAWILYAIAALMWIASRTIASVGSAPQESKASRLDRVAHFVTALGAGLHIAGIAMRCFIAGRPPVTNMYESVIWVSLGQLVFAWILYLMSRQSIAICVATVLGTVGLIVADAAPAMMDPGIHPLVPVLRSNYWLTIHVLTITLGYAALALALGLGNVSLFHFLRSNRPGAKAKIAQMNQLTYRAMQFGVVLLAAGTILGGVWADYSWGRFWGWDPKEVWALIALLCYLIILHARFTGWVGQFGFASWSIVSFLSVIMAWYGVNFVLGAGLHSYGFSSGGFTSMFGFVALQLGYVGVVAWVYKRRESSLRAVVSGAADAPSAAK